jgi:hypothetical protein
MGRVVDNKEYNDKIQHVFSKYGEDCNKLRQEYKNAELRSNATMQFVFIMLIFCATMLVIGVYMGK